MATLVNVVIQSAPTIAGRTPIAMASRTSAPAPRAIVRRSSGGAVRAAAGLSPGAGVASIYVVAREIVTTRRRERYSSAAIASTNGAAER